MASAKAKESNMGGRIFPAESGFRPMASMALPPMYMIATAGAMPPIAITAPPVSVKFMLQSPPRAYYLRLAPDVRFRVHYYGVVW